MPMRNGIVKIRYRPRIFVKDLRFMNIYFNILFLYILDAVAYSGFAIANNNMVVDFW
jgi:hypothetical protein